MATWQLQEAKAKLSEVIKRANVEGPQTITLRGVKRALVIPFEERRSNDLTPGERKESEEFLALLRSCPDFEIPPRGRMRMRKPVKF